VASNEAACAKLQLVVDDGARAAASAACRVTLAAETASLLEVPVTAANCMFIFKSNSDNSTLSARTRTKDAEGLSVTGVLDGVSDAEGKSRLRVDAVAELTEDNVAFAVPDSESNAPKAVRVAAAESFCASVGAADAEDGAEVLAELDAAPKLLGE